MAEQGGYRLTTCSACNGDLVDPKCLDCAHTFCRQCLEQRRANDEQLPRRDVDVVRCSLCDSITVVPTDGLGSLQTNSLAARLVRLKRLNVEQQTRDVACSACGRSSDDDVTTAAAAGSATVYCVDCDDTLCRQCADAHGKLKPTRRHAVVEFGDGFSSRVEQIAKTGAPSSSTRCDKHPEEQLTWYCRDCSTLVCSSCAVLTHRTHELRDVAEQAAELRRQLATAALHPPEEEQEREEQVDGPASTSATSARQTLDESLSNVRAEVDAEVARLKRGVDDYRKQLSDVVSYWHLDRLCAVDGVQRDHERQLAALEGVLVACRELASSGSQADVCNMAAKYVVKATELLAAPEVELKAQGASLTFVVGDDIQGSAGNLFGTIGVRKRDGQ